MNLNVGLIMGKFMPLHKGHLAMIEFGLEQVDKLILLVVAKETDPIDGSIRLGWLKEIYGNEPRIQVEFMANTLPHDGAFRKEDTLAWCAYIKNRFPYLDAFISSEAYGDLLAEYMAIKHLRFDTERIEHPISGSAIRKEPLKHLDCVPEMVKQYYMAMSKTEM